MSSSTTKTQLRITGETMKNTSLILITILCFALVGACLVGCNVTVNYNYKTTNHTVDSFDDILIDVDVAEIIIKKSTDAKYDVVCYETDNIFHEVTVANNQLKIQSVSTNNIINLSTVLMKTLSVTVYLPEDHYGNLKISADTGAIRIDSGLLFDNIEISTDTGAISCRADTNGVLDIETDTGAISVENVTYANKVNVDSATGFVKLSNVNCNNLEINVDTGKVDVKNVECSVANIDTDTGAVSLTNMSTSNLVVDTDTGSIALNNVEINSSINIESNTGSIHGTLRLADNVESHIHTDTGNITVTYLD